MAEPNERIWDAVMSDNEDGTITRLPNTTAELDRIVASARADERAKVLAEVLAWATSYDVITFELDGEECGFVLQRDLFRFLERPRVGAPAVTNRMGEELTGDNALIVQAARIALKGITTRSEDDALSVLTRRLAPKTKRFARCTCGHPIAQVASSGEPLCAICNQDALRAIGEIA